MRKGMIPMNLMIGIIAVLVIAYFGGFLPGELYPGGHYTKVFMSFPDSSFPSSTPRNTIVLSTARSQEFYYFSGANQICISPDVVDGIIHGAGDKYTWKNVMAECQQDVDGYWDPTKGCVYLPDKLVGMYIVQDNSYININGERKNILPDYKVWKGGYGGQGASGSKICFEGLENEPHQYTVYRDFSVYIELSKTEGGEITIPDHQEAEPISPSEPEVEPTQEPLSFMDRIIAPLKTFWNALFGWMG